MKNPLNLVDDYRNLFRRDNSVEDDPGAPNCHNIERITRTLRSKVEKIIGVPVPSDCPLPALLTKDSISKEDPIPENFEGDTIATEVNDDSTINIAQLINIYIKELQRMTKDDRLMSRILERGHGERIIKEPGDMLSALRFIFEDTESRGEKVTSELIIAVFISAARLAMIYVLRGDITVEHIKSRHGNVSSSDNLQWLLRNYVANVLRLIGLMPGITYDQLYQRKLYLFMNAEKDQDLKSKSVLVERLLELRDSKTGKLILDEAIIMDLGAGIGRDAIHLVEGNPNIKYAITVDKSAEAIKILKDRLLSFTDSGQGADSVIDQESGSDSQMELAQESNSESTTNPKSESASDTKSTSGIDFKLDSKLIKKIRPIKVGMRERLENMAERQKIGQDFQTDMPGRPNVIIANSVVHRMDEEGLQKISKNILTVLPEGGYCAFGWKETGGRFYGSGHTVSKSADKSSANYGSDAQMRFERPLDIYKSLLVRHQNISSVELIDGKWKLFVFDLIYSSTIEGGDSFEIEGDRQLWNTLVLRKICVAEVPEQSQATDKQKMLRNDRTKSFLRPFSFNK